MRAGWRAGYAAATRLTVARFTTSLINDLCSQLQQKPSHDQVQQKSELQGHYFGRALYLPTTTPLLHTSLRPAVIASTPPNPIPQSLTGASRGAIEGVYVPTILSSFVSQER